MPALLRLPPILQCKLANYCKASLHYPSPPGIIEKARSYSPLPSPQGGSTAQRSSCFAFGVAFCCRSLCSTCGSRLAGSASGRKSVAPTKRQPQNESKCERQKTFCKLLSFADSLKHFFIIICSQGQAASPSFRTLTSIFILKC